jgi:hypothetical protein
MLAAGASEAALASARPILSALAVARAVVGTGTSFQRVAAQAAPAPRARTHAIHALAVAGAVVRAVLMQPGRATVFSGP